MANWTITIVSGARADIYKIPRGKAADITDAISALGKDPKPPGYEEVDDEPNTYKIKAGEYTVEYELIEDEMKIRVLVVR